MAKAMVVPKAIQATVEIEPIERGTGINVAVEISNEANEQLELEMLRRKRQGLPSRKQDVIREVIEQARREWPRIIIS